MHKDLSDETRDEVETMATIAAGKVDTRGESLAISREAMINAFDEAAASGA